MTQPANLKKKVYLIIIYIKINKYFIYIFRPEKLKSVKGKRASLSTNSFKDYLNELTVESFRNVRPYPAPQKSGIEDFCLIVLSSIK